MPAYALVPVDKPPRPLKLTEVLDWTVCHSDPPAVWLITLRAWYRLGEPSAAYLRNYGVMQRRLAFCHVTAAALRRWGCHFSPPRYYFASKHIQLMTAGMCPCKQSHTPRE